MSNIKKHSTFFPVVAICGFLGVGCGDASYSGSVPSSLPIKALPLVHSKHLDNGWDPVFGGKYIIPNEQTNSFLNALQKLQVTDLDTAPIHEIEDAQWWNVSNSFFTKSYLINEKGESLLKVWLVHEGTNTFLYVLDICL